jgi:hypothetical protein
MLGRRAPRRSVPRATGLPPPPRRSPRSFRYRHPLTHFNRDVFSSEPMTEAPTARISVSFLIGPDGTARDVTVEDLNENGLGRLTRVGPK